MLFFHKDITYTFTFQYIHVYTYIGLNFPTNITAQALTCLRGWNECVTSNMMCFCSTLKVFSHRLFDLVSNSSIRVWAFSFHGKKKNRSKPKCITSRSSKNLHPPSTTRERFRTWGACTASYRVHICPNQLQQDGYQTIPIPNSGSASFWRKQ